MKLQEEGEDGLRNRVLLPASEQHYLELLELLAHKGGEGEKEQGAGGGNYGSPGEGGGTVEGKQRRSRGKKTQSRVRDGGGGSKKRSFDGKELGGDGNPRAFWPQMEEYFRLVTSQDVRLLRPLTRLRLCAEGEGVDRCLAMPQLGGVSWGGEEGAEAMQSESVTRVKRKILAASPVSKKRKICNSTDAKVITTVISPTENDDEELCHVCNGGDSEQWNQILFCDSCDVAVHQDCYGIREVPEGEWLCTWCRAKSSRRAFSQQRRSSAAEALHADVASVQNGPPDCLLCPVRGGALKPVAEGDSNGCSIRGSAKLKFAHLFCCQWVPETYIQSMEAMEPIKNVEGVREERWKLLCAVCKEKHGACIQCSHGKSPCNCNDFHGLAELMPDCRRVLIQRIEAADWHIIFIPEGSVVSSLNVHLRFVLRLNGWSDQVTPRGRLTGMCATAFHPLCAREAKLRMEVSSREDSEDVDLRAYCQKHSTTRGGKLTITGGEITESGESVGEGQCEIGETLNLREPSEHREETVHQKTDGPQPLVCKGSFSVEGAGAAPTAGKSIAKLLGGRSLDEKKQSAALPAIVEREVANNANALATEVVSREAAHDTMKSSDVSETGSLVKGKNGVRKVSLRQRSPCNMATAGECGDVLDAVVLDHSHTEGLCLENRLPQDHAESDVKGTAEDLATDRLDVSALGSTNESCPVESEYDTCLNEERRQRGLSGDASTSETPIKSAQIADSEMFYASEKGKRGTLCESQGPHLHLAGFVEEGQCKVTTCDEPLVVERPPGDEGIIRLKQRVPHGVFIVGTVSTDVETSCQAQQVSDLLVTQDVRSKFPAPKSVSQKGSARAETGMLCITTAEKGDNMRNPECVQDELAPEERPAFQYCVATNSDAGLITDHSGKVESSSENVQEVKQSLKSGAEMVGSQAMPEKNGQSIKEPYQPRLRIKLGGDFGVLSGRQELQGPEIGSSPVFEGKTVHRSEFGEEISRFYPHPYVLKKLELCQRSYDGGTKDEHSALTGSDQFSEQGASTVAKMCIGPGVAPADDSDAIFSGKACGLQLKTEVQGILSPEDYRAGVELNPGNDALAIAESDDGGSNSLDAQWKQLNDAKHLGLFDLVPEDEIVGEILILQKELVDLAQINDLRRDTLISSMLNRIPEEQRLEQKHVQDLALVKEYSEKAKEAKKQGRKEKRDKEAQAAVAAATAAAAASPRLSYMRRDGVGASHEDFMIHTPDASLESGGSQGLTPTAFPGASHGFIRGSKPPVPKPPKLALSAGRPSRPGSQVKSTTSKLLVAKASTPKVSGLFRDYQASYLEETPRCSICQYGESVRSNKIICCDRCRVSVHQDCYGISRVPLMAWLCQPCSEMQRQYQSLKPPEVDATGKLTPGVQCAICPDRTGAFKRSSDGRWAHVFCAQWLPETAAGKDQTGSIEGLEFVFLDRYALLCSICHRQQGACLTCNFGHCHGAFHPSCARDYGLYMNVKSCSGGRIQYRAYCERHSPQQRAKAESKQRGGSDEMKILKEIRLEFEKVRLICERVVRREKLKRELLQALKDAGLWELRNATLPASQQDQHHLDSYPALHGLAAPATRGPDEIPWSDGSVPLQRAHSDKPVQHADSKRKSEELKKQKRQKRRPGEKLHREKLMTAVEASEQNLKLPKGYAYVPVDTVPAVQPVNNKQQSPSH